jgi:hypothetical protein
LDPAGSRELRDLYTDDNNTPDGRISSPTLETLRERHEPT